MTSSVRPDTFALAFPPGASVQSFDNGFAAGRAAAGRGVDRL